MSGDRSNLADPAAGARAVPVLDAAALRAHCFGDAALQREVLGLFVRQAAAHVAATGSEAAEADRRRAAHTLLGAARAVGAGRVALAAERVERTPGNGGAVEALRAEVAAALAAIAAHLG